MFESGGRRRRSIVRRTWPRVPALLAVVVLIVLGLRQAQRAPQAPEAPRESDVVHVVRVVDGDTLLLEKKIRVRLLGVNTPEVAHDDQPGEPLGDEAADFTRRFLDGKSVTLEFDRERVDDYGRTLAYVFADGRMLNEALIEAGLSEAVTRHPYRSDRKKLFEQAEARAREKGIGLWSLQRSRSR